MPGAICYEPGSTTDNKTGTWRTFRPVIEQSKCIKCKQCETYCPDCAIDVKDKPGPTEVDYNFCKGCGICAAICPVKCIAMQEEEKQTEGFTCATDDEKEDKKKVECSEE